MRRGYLFMARSRVNRGNLWSLSRGLSRNKEAYMVNLFSTDPDPNAGQDGTYSRSELLAGFCEFFFEICLDQIHFMEKLLRLEEVESRIEWFVEKLSRGEHQELHPRASRLLRALFMHGNVERGEGPTILNTSKTTYRRILRSLFSMGLVESDGPKSPLEVRIPSRALPFYFPNLYTPSVVGAEYWTQMAGASRQTVDEDEGPAPR